MSPCAGPHLYPQHSGGRGQHISKFKASLVFIVPGLPGLRCETVSNEQTKQTQTRSGKWKKRMSAVFSGHQEWTVRACPP